MGMVGCLSLLLFSHELRIDPVRMILEKRLVVSDLHNFSCLHYNDLVSIFDGRKPVSNYDGGNTASKFLPDLVNSTLYLFLISLI